MLKIILLVAIIAAAVFGFLRITSSTTTSFAKDASSCEIEAPNFFIYSDASTVKQSPCNFSIIYAYDDLGGWYKDFGDGQIYTSPSTITSIQDLDSATLTTCGYQVHARGKFDNNAGLVTGDSGNILLIKHCYGYAYNDFGGHGTELYQLISPDDPRYTGDSWAFSTWEFQLWIKSHFGNLVVRSISP